MKTYSVAAARSALPRLLDRVDKGEVVEISRRGKTIAMLVPPGDFLNRSDLTQRFRERVAAWRSEQPEGERFSRSFFSTLRDRSRSGR